jgi:hypothetical protein
MKKIFLLLFMLLPLAVGAQNGQQQEFDDFLKQAQGEFESYEKQINYEFAEALRTQWEEFQVFKGEEVPVKPKPTKMHVAPAETDLVSEVIPATPAPVENSFLGTAARAVTSAVIHKWLTWQSRQITAEDMLKARKTISDHIDKSKLVPKPLKQMMTFYNVPVSIDVPAEYTQYKMAGNNENDVADFWQYLTASSFEYVVKQVAEDAEKKGLENWGLFKYIETVSENVYTKGHEDEQEVFKVFLANQLGLDVKVGRANDKLVAMVAIAQRVYEWMSIRLDDKKYYFKHDDEDLTSLHTYKMTFKEPVAQIDLLKSMPDLLSPPGKIQTRTFTSSAFGCDINIPLDTNICHFMEEFPRVRCDIPAMTDVGSQLAQSLYDTMYPKVKDMSQHDAVHTLMKFMYNDFAYATDQDQFGYEKPFFCEENFLYPYNDCEDRSILFSYLVRHILGMEVILLDYPDHIMTAVYFDEQITGSYVIHDGRKFYICDPTYLDSSPGMLYPGYRGVGCQILTI